MTNDDHGKHVLVTGDAKEGTHLVLREQPHPTRAEPLCSRLKHEVLDRDRHVADDPLEFWEELSSSRGGPA